MRRLIVIAAVLLSLASESAGARRRPVRPGPDPPALGACPSSLDTPLLTILPVAIADFIAFRPLGFVSPPIHVFPAKHSAFSMTLPGSAPVPKPLRSPSRARVAEIWEASFSTGGRNYQLYLYPCTEVRVYLGHAASISPRLQEEFARGEPRCNTFHDGTATVTTCRRDGMSLIVEAGEIIGSGPDTAGIDFGIVDFRRSPAPFIVRDHYDFYYPFWSAPRDYFTAAVRAELDSKTGSIFGTKMRTAEPIGGTHMHDLAGTAQGNWFTGGKYHRTTTDLSAFLSLVHDYVVPSQPLLVAGNSIAGLQRGIYSYDPRTAGQVNRDFDEIVSDGRTYCFESFRSGQSEGGMPLGRAEGAIMLTLPTATTLRIEFLPGAGCAATDAFVFGPNATTFER